MANVTSISPVAGECDIHEGLPPSETATFLSQRLWSHGPFVAPRSGTEGEGRGEKWGG